MRRRISLRKRQIVSPTKKLKLAALSSSGSHVTFCYCTKTLMHVTAASEWTKKPKYNHENRILTKREIHQWNVIINLSFFSNWNFSLKQLFFFKLFQSITLLVTTLNYDGVTLHSATRLLTPSSLTKDTQNSGSVAQCPSLPKKNKNSNKKTFKWIRKETKKRMKERREGSIPKLQRHLPI